MLSHELKHYLDEHDIAYDTISHTTSYTASQTAQSAHIPGKRLAKVVIAKIDGELAMVALPACAQLDLKSLQTSAGAKQVELAHEYEFTDKFPDCDVGAMPPIGEMYGMDVYLADSLSHEDWIAFNGGTHTDLLQMSTKDFLKLVHPKLITQR